MKQATFYFKDTYIEATDPKAVDLCISMLPYSDLEMIEVIDDDGSKHYFQVTKFMHCSNN